MNLNCKHRSKSRKTKHFSLSSSSILNFFFKSHMEEYNKITVNILYRTYNITHINVYIITQSITVFHFTLFKIIVIKFAELRNFVLSAIMLLNLGADG